MKCINHLNTDAVGICAKCGRGLCAECKHELVGKNYCQVCADVYSQLNPAEIHGTPAPIEDKAPQRSTSNFVSTSEFAGFWRRLGAQLIDGIILFIVGLPLRFFAPEAYTYGLSSAISLIYIVGFWTWKGQTPGKMAVGVKIVDTNMKPIGFGRAIIRYLAETAMSILTIIGAIIFLMHGESHVGIAMLLMFLGMILQAAAYLMIAFDGRKQALYDKIAGTFVIRT